MIRGKKEAGRRANVVDMRPNRIVQFTSLSVDERKMIEKKKAQTGIPLVFSHPAYPILVTPEHRSHHWACGVCGHVQASAEDGSESAVVAHRGHYRSIYTKAEPYDICSACMKSDHDHWDTNVDEFIRGAPFTCYGVKNLGTIVTGSDFPTSTDQECLLQVIDDCIDNDVIRPARGEISSITFSVDGLTVSSDRYFVIPRRRPHTANASGTLYGIRDIFSLTFVDDNPNFYLLLLTQQSEIMNCTFFSTYTAEVASKIVLAFEKWLEHTYTEAVLLSLDDNIAAGVEGRDTIEEQREQRLREEAAKRAMTGFSKHSQAEIARRNMEVMNDKRRISSFGDYGESDESDGGDGQDSDAEDGGYGNVHAPPLIKKRQSVVDFFGFPDEDGGNHRASHDLDDADTPPTSPLAPPRRRSVGLLEKSRLLVSTNYRGSSSPNLISPTPHGEELRHMRPRSRTESALTVQTHESQSPLMAAVSAQRTSPSAFFAQQQQQQSQSPRPNSRSSIGHGLGSVDQWTSVAQQAKPESQNAADKIRRKKSSVTKATVKTYMETLNAVFTQAELSEFSRIVRTYKASNDFHGFTRSLLALYNRSRFHLLPGLRLFLSAGDRPNFESFLRENNIDVLPMFQE